MEYVMDSSCCNMQHGLHAPLYSFPEAIRHNEITSDVISAINNAR